jgi:cephalosporin hydroxylase
MRIANLPKEVEETIYLNSETSWLGYRMQKSQLDLFQYANLIYDIRPDILIECGTWHGGSALYYATIMDAINHGTVLTIDVWDWGLRPKHDRIWYVHRIVSGREYRRDHHEYGGAGHARDGYPR